MTDNEASSNFQELLTVGSRVRRAISQDRILDNIKFDEMCRRYEAVHVAYESTFNWIYEDLDTVQAGVSFSLPDLSSRIYNNDVSQMQSQSREMFINWLSSGSPSPPVFHISGKLGSGKSTLMKFLCCHPRTVQELNKWAGTNSLDFIGVCEC
jgi:ABC-type bacteriocin/lantibiotic exporter with double-glycine peptidase domain